MDAINAEPSGWSNDDNSICSKIKRILKSISKHLCKCIRYFSRCSDCCGRCGKKKHILGAEHELESGNLEMKCHMSQCHSSDSTPDTDSPPDTDTTPVTDSTPDLDSSPETDSSLDTTDLTQDSDKGPYYDLIPLEKFKHLCHFRRYNIKSDQASKMNLTFQDLQDMYKNDELEDCIRLLSELTVQVQMRPSETKFISLGDGRVCDVSYKTEASKCNCYMCQFSELDTRSDCWWAVTVQTSPQLMRNLCATIRKLSGVPHLAVEYKGVYLRAEIFKPAKDYGELEVVTCDRDLASMLGRAQRRFSVLYECGHFTMGITCKVCMFWHKKKVNVALSHKCPQGALEKSSSTQSNLMTVSSFNSDLSFTSHCLGDSGAYVFSF